MITEALIHQLKQTDISKDAEKTKQRVREAWEAAPKAEQTAILELTGLTRPSLRRVYITGSISAKAVVAMAQTLNVEPLYLTGEADEKGACSEESLRAFLVDHGYEKLLPAPDDAKPKRRRQAKQKPSEQPQPEPEAGIAAETPAETETIAPQEESPVVVLSDAAVSEAVNEDTQAFIDNATEDEIILLVKSILLRAKAGGKHAETAQKLKLFLLG